MLCSSLVAVCVMFLDLPTIAPVPPDTMISSHYISTTVGSKYVFKCVTSVSGKTEETSEDVRIVKKVEHKNGTAILTIDVTENDKRVICHRVTSTSHGLFYSGYNDVLYRNPLCMLRLPHKAGTKWRTVLTWEDDLQLEVESLDGGIEEIEVPAGKYTALRVTSECAAAGDSMRSTTWYVRGIGPVKSVQRLGKYDTVITLESFTPGKK